LAGQTIVKAGSLNTVDELVGFLEPFEYVGKGRRDPFKPYRALESLAEGGFSGPLLPLQRFNLSEVTLAGIIWDVTNPQALFIDPKGQTHTIGVNARIGRNNGYVALIREGEVVVVETVRVRGEVLYNTKVLKLDR
jgi:type IV pilus assembly protein PilP